MSKGRLLARKMGVWHVDVYLGVWGGGEGDDDDTYYFLRDNFESHAGLGWVEDFGLWTEREDLNESKFHKS
jgi:hypothetical protein